MYNLCNNVTLLRYTLSIITLYTYKQNELTNTKINLYTHQQQYNTNPIYWKISIALLLAQEKNLEVFLRRTKSIVMSKNKNLSGVHMVAQVIFMGRGEKNVKFI